MSPPDLRSVQRDLFRALRDRPLNLLDAKDRSLYEPLHDNDHDPVRRLVDTIELSESESVQLVAGFRGTGKTTEFSRLEGDLWTAGKLVIRVDLDEYLDMNSAVDIRDFLLIVAGAVSEKLTDEKLLGDRDGLRKSFWERARSLLPTSLEAKEITAKTPAGDLKVALKSDPTFRDKIRDAFSGRLGELKEAVHQHHREILEALRERNGREVSVVVILDSLEHLRGTVSNAKAVRDSVEELFFTYADAIKLPETHMVLSVPAFLVLEAKNLAAQFVNGALQTWPAFQVQDRRGQRTSVVDRMVHLVDRRGDWKRILPNREALETLIFASGGHLRDLLNMLIEAIHISSYGVKPDMADKIVNVARRAYLPLYKDEISVLRSIDERKDPSHLSTPEREYLLRFLDAGLVLCYLNDDFWYGVHPLVRDVVRSGP